jgi:hypothetical protein
MVGKAGTVSPEAGIAPGHSSPATKAVTGPIAFTKLLKMSFLLVWNRGLVPIEIVGLLVFSLPLQVCGCEFTGKLVLQPTASAVARKSCFHPARSSLLRSVIAPPLVAPHCLRHFRFVVKINSPLRRVLPAPPGRAASGP